MKTLVPTYADFINATLNVKEKKSKLQEKKSEENNANLDKLIEKYLETYEQK